MHDLSTFFSGIFGLSDHTSMRKLDQAHQLWQANFSNYSFHSLKILVIVLLKAKSQLQNNSLWKNTGYILSVSSILLNHFSKSFCTHNAGSTDSTHLCISLAHIMMQTTMIWPYRIFKHAEQFFMQPTMFWLNNVYFTILDNHPSIHLMLQHNGYS